MRWLLLAALSLFGAAGGPAHPHLEQAYAALAAGDYDTALAAFERAATREPERADIRKDFGYALLKAGETLRAREQFAAAYRLSPGDAALAREYAYLCYETRQPVIARRIFDRLRRAGDADAERAFRNIDQPLAEGIARWKQAVAASPGNFSAHQELARLAEERDELALSAEHYARAWELRRDRRETLLDLGRVWKELGRVEDAHAALLAASRGAEPRVADRARELLPDRYPFVYEFEKGLALDPQNVELRREFAYLLLEMGRRGEAETQFSAVLAAAPADRLTLAQLGFLRWSRGDRTGAKPLLEKVLEGEDDEIADRVRQVLGLPQTLRRRPEVPRREVTREARVMAQRSLDKGYLPDALKYLRVAHENDPLDFDVMLKMGWAYNVLKQDEEAAKWFRLARQSPDAAVAAPAAKAYRNLRPAQSPVRLTAWLFPMYSSRWHGAFVYGQAKAEFRLGRLPLRPYISARFIGDTRGQFFLQGIAPQYLSEGSVITAAGIATASKHGLYAWAEAGQAWNYRQGGLRPDYRGGVNFTRGFGHMLTGESHGWFGETANDGVFVSRFDNNFLVYSQNKAGFTLPGAAFPSQLFWNWNVTVDARRQYWGNFVETGPGLRFRLPGALRPLLFTANVLRGDFLVNEGNPFGRRYYDLRIGIWYALTR
jgi:tetratricopeptide (TPR) repeat protein